MGRRRDGAKKAVRVTLFPTLGTLPIDWVG